MNQTRTILLAAVISVFSFLPASCGNTKSKPDEHPPVPDQAIEQFNVMETKEGKPNWVLEASTAQILESQKKVYLQHPRIKFYQKGEYVSTLVATRGKINTDTYDIWGEENCLLTTAKGERLETKNLHYRSDIQKVVTDDKVKLTRQDEIITGQGMEATPDLESIIIKKQKVELKEAKGGKAKK